MSNIFLSHSHADKPFARRLAFYLESAGHEVWIDEAEINIGDSLIEKIREGIDQVDYVAAVLSEASINSPWVTRELDIASNREIEERRVVVLPLMVQMVELPGFLKGKFYGDFTDDSQFESAAKLLLRKLDGGKKTGLKLASNYYIKNVLILQLQQILEQGYSSDNRGPIIEYLEGPFHEYSGMYDRSVFGVIVDEFLCYRTTPRELVNKYWSSLCL